MVKLQRWFATASFLFMRVAGCRCATRSMVHELILASFCRCCSCGWNVTVVVRLRCKPAMVIGVSFSVCVGVVVGETFFGDATTGINGGSFTYCAHTGWILVAIQFFIFIFKAYYASVDFETEAVRVKYASVHNRGIKALFFISAGYVSVLKPRPNDQNNRDRNICLH